MRFVQKHNFLPLGTYLRLQIMPDDVVAAVEWPADYIVRPYQGKRKTLGIYTMLMTDCYGDLWGHAKHVAEDEHRKGLSRFDTEGIFLLFTNENKAVGMGRAQLTTQINVQDGSRTNTVDVPGIIPAHRHPETVSRITVTQPTLGERADG